MTTLRSVMRGLDPRISKPADHFFLLAS
jgi:hypothetical protein